MVDGKLVDEAVPALRAIAAACSTTTWPTARAASTAGTRSLKGGINFRSPAVQGLQPRKIGEFANTKSASGELLRHSMPGPPAQANGCCNDADMAFINSLMKPCHTRRPIRQLDCRPRMGINQQPVDHRYVKID